MIWQKMQVKSRNHISEIEAQAKPSIESWPAYAPQQIEGYWQRQWQESDLYRTSEGRDRPKFYCLDFFPYPSGDGLHVGHCRNYIPTDVLARFRRMQGYNVLHPMGWDAFGEPAEQYAVAHGVHPRVTTDRNTANFRRQMTLIGTSYDWSREIDSSRPEFYRWTQYFFLLLYKRGLAYRDTNWQWWCPVCQTTLSSHEVSGGVCWRGHSGVTRREIPAWYFKITAYADQLLAGLDTIDWPERIKTMQRNWIGRSDGCEIVFRSETGKPAPVFTTRPDTLFGVTFFVLAPEHPLVNEVTDESHRQAVAAYQASAASQSEVERMSETRQKTGVFTGGFVLHPLSGERIPVWVADYVLPEYGTGAVMGVPAHDQRDYDFARFYNLPVREVVASEEGQGPGSEPMPGAYTGEGWLVNSGEFNGLSSAEAIPRIGEALEKRNLGKRTVQYRMHDWLISRQRYWGTPIPIIYCSTCGMVPVPEEDLPVLLPPMENFEPDGSGRSPLARLPDFLHTTCPGCGGPAQRETDTMGGFADSSWYFLRFTSPKTGEGPFEPEAMRYWMPVDIYVGGAEHAVLHLLYARFWVQVMADAGLVPYREPFAKLLNQGQLLGPDGRRMSKSRGNVITPDSVVDKFGADTLRVYELFMAPFDQDIAWSLEGIYGSRRFLNRVWNMFRETYLPGEGYSGKDDVLEHRLHRTIRHVSQRLEDFRFNTMVSALMEFTNDLTEAQQAGTWKTAVFHQALEKLLILMAPAAPHITEELWRLTGHAGSVHQQPWPAWDAALAREPVTEIAVQVNGRLREVIEVSLEASQAEVEEQAYARPKIQQYLDQKQVAKVIYVPGKILNIVLRG
jgi:leucyl-tRNA synthetase